MLITVLLLGTLAGCSSNEKSDFDPIAEFGSDELYVFNWGEYISDSYEDGALDVNKEFEKLTGIKVNYVTFESNEDMYAKIKNGGASYDIITINGSLSRKSI